MNDPISYLYDTLNSSDLKNKDDLMGEVRTWVIHLIFLS